MSLIGIFSCGVRSEEPLEKTLSTAVGVTRYQKGYRGDWSEEEKLTKRDRKRERKVCRAFRDRLYMRLLIGSLRVVTIVTR